MFLYFRNLYGNAVLIPSFDIDIIWQSHQVHPKAYYDDCLRLFGKLINRDQLTFSLNALKLYKNGYKRAKELWRKVFRERFFNSGSMFRGENSSEKLIPMTRKYLNSFLLKTMELALCIKSRKDEVTNYKLEIYLCSDRFKRCICFYDYSKKKESKEKIIKFRTCENLFFQLKLFKKNRISRKETWNSLMATEELFDRLSDKDSQTGLKCEIYNDQEKFDLVKINFIIKSFSYDCFEGAITLSEFILVSLNLTNHIFGPLSLFLPEDQYFECLMACHSIKSIIGKHIFDVRVTHIKKFDQAMVHVYCENKLCVLGHLIDKEQLPNRLQVEDYLKYPTLNSSDAKKAMIIKDNLGDWMIIVPRWLQTKIKGFGYLNQKVGGFLLRIYHLRTGKEYRCFKNENLMNITFKIDNVLINFSTGTISINSHEESMLIPNFVCLAFAFAVLYVLCKPKSGNQAEPEIQPIEEHDVQIYHEMLKIESDIKVLGKPLIVKEKKKKKFRLKKIISHLGNFQFILAAGYIHDPFISRNCGVTAPLQAKSKLKFKRISKVKEVTSNKKESKDEDTKSAHNQLTNQQNEIFGEDKDVNEIQTNEIYNENQKTREDLVKIKKNTSTTD